MKPDEHRRWLEGRQKGIGGSDIAAICGWSPFRDAHDIYLDKTRPPDEAEENIHMLRGNLLEEHAVQLYQEATGHEGRRQPQRSHPDHEWALANVDWQIYGDERRAEPYDETGVLEVKAPGSRSFRRILEAGIYDSYIAQVNWYMGILGYPWCAIALINLEVEEGPLLYYNRTFNSELFDAMLERAEAFWHGHVEQRIPPDPSEFRMAEAQPFESTSSDVELVEDAQLRLLGDTLVGVRESRKELQQREKDLKKELQAAIDELEADRIQLPGVGKFYYDQRSRQGKIDTGKLFKVGPLDPDAVYRLLNRYEGEQGIEASAAELYERMLVECELDLETLRKPGSKWKQLSIYPE